MSEVEAMEVPGGGETLHEASDHRNPAADIPEQQQQPEKDQEGEASSSHSSSSSSSDDDEDDEEEEETENEIKVIEQAIRQNPNDYDSHVKYIKILRKAGDINKLRMARETMNSVFPLTPKMWQEWARDEAILNTGTDGFASSESIYQRGVQEYLSVPLWCDYLNFIQEHDQEVSQLTQNGVIKMRDLFEQALVAGGLHVTEGSNIWKLYREYEEAYHLSMDENSLEANTKQVDRIRGIFHRQLAVPLADLCQTLQAYKQWEVQQQKDGISENDNFVISPNLSLMYKKALEMYNARAHHEDRISRVDSSETDRLQNFLTYIRFEEQSGDPARVQVVYERAIKEFPISNDLWLRYTSYVDKKLKIRHVLKSIYSRATRSCPWIGELWARYLLSLERIGAPEEDLSMVFEQSFECTFSSLEEYLDLFLTRIDGLRRRFSVTGADSGCEGENYGVIRSLFQRAADYLHPHLQNANELVRVHSYWSRLEADLLKDLSAARGVWESLIKVSGMWIEVWLNYISMEIKLNNFDQARRLYKRCFSQRFKGTGSVDICKSWLQFEREYGTLDDYDYAKMKVMPRLEELQRFLSQEEAKHQGSSLPGSAEENVGSLERKVLKRKADSFSSKKPHVKRQKEVSAVTANKDGRKVSDVSEAPASEEAIPKSVDAEVKQEQPSNRSSNYSDQCTAFISNLSLEVTEENLRGFLDKKGGVIAIRLLKEKITGKSRGLAYVDFSDEEHLTAALTLNKQMLRGKRISIAKSDPSVSRKKADTNGSSIGQGKRATSTKSFHDGSERGSSQQFPPVAHRRAGHVQLKGSNTFAMPRAIARPLGWTAGAKRDDGKEEETPKSNDEFRKMFLKKE